MEFIGLDIGTVGIKLVKVKKTGNDRFRLEAAGVAASPAGGMLSDSEQGLLNVAEVVKKLLAEVKSTTKQVVTALPESEVFTRIVVMPKMSKSELDSAINWEAEQNIPLPLSEVNYSYTIVDNLENGSMEVMVVAAPKRLVEKYEKVLALAELIPVGMETELLAGSRALITKQQQGLTMILVMGARTCDVGIVKQEKLVFTRSIASAGEALSRALMTNLQLDSAQAESFKRTYGLFSNQLEGKVALAMQPVVEVLLREVKRTVSFYESKAAGQKVKTAILIGGSANLPGLAPVLTNGLGLEVQIGNVLAKIEQAHRGVNILPEVLPQYGVAMGLAMKEV